MIKSMTGYGRAQALLDRRDITVEIKSVNHRYFDFSTRLPRLYSFLEDKLKSHVQTFITRGKVDVFVSVVQVDGPEAQVQLNHPLFESYLVALRGMSETYNISDDLTLSTFATNQELFTVVKKEEDADVLWNQVKQVADEALKSFVSMRTVEGATMKEDLGARADFILEATHTIESLSAASVDNARIRLEERIRELLGQAPVDEARLLTEVAIFADKGSVTEELVRLRSHIAQFHTFLVATEPIGRKMDFLIQEMNREINTIGSKCNDLGITRLVVDVKAEIEKIREQVQNIE